jgi:hypothetical protein
MSGVRLLDRIYRQETERVNAELVKLGVGHYGSSFVSIRKHRRPSPDNVTQLYCTSKDEASNQSKPGSRMYSQSSRRRV